MKNLDWNYFQKQKRILVSILIILNIPHLFINTGVVNEKFNPLFGLFLILCLYWLAKKTGKMNSEMLFILIISLTFGFQVLGYLINNFRVRDYIDLVVFQTNIPDMIIFFTLLTYLFFKAKSYQLKN